jgi:hypothetical protein
MYMEPWAKFTILNTPKIKLSPEAMRKRTMAIERPPRSWKTTQPGSERQEVKLDTLSSIDWWLEGAGPEG